MAFWLGILIVLALSLAGAWDVYAITSDPIRPTVSETLRDWAVKFPPAAIVIGIILGHLLWPGERVIRTGADNGRQIG